MPGPAIWPGPCADQAARGGDRQCPGQRSGPGHALIKRLEAETDNARASDLALLLLEQAQVAEGAQLEDPAAFVQRLNRVILEAPAAS